jgi:tetratricopeptide (TPR) repeat protein
VIGPTSLVRSPAIIGTLQAFREAVALHDRGRLAEAGQRYERVLRADGRHFAALYRLGLIRLQQGRFDDAVSLFRSARKVEPRSADTELHLGMALAGMKSHEEAIRHYQKALILRPDFPEVHNNIGYSLQALGRVEQAITHYKKALAINPRYAVASNNLGTALAALKRHEEAIPRLEAAIAIRSDYVDAHISLANVFGAIKRYGEAAQHYEKVVALRPNDMQARMALANTLRRLDRPDEAIAQYEKILAAAPTFSAALDSLGNTLHELGRSEEAVAYFRRALDIDGSDLRANNNLGRALVALGRSDEARAVLEKSADLTPHKAGCYWNLTFCKRFTEDDHHFVAMRKLAANTESLSEAELIDLHFALGKAFADVGDQQQSFDHILSANALKRRQIKFDEVKSLEWFDRIRTVFTAELVRDKVGLGNPSDVPVFIIGMPRSGTTLIEQILASHPSVFGAGELPEMGNLVKRVGGPDGPSYPEFVSTMSADELRRLGASYVEAVQRKAPTAVRITDKMPHNFSRAGLIHLALPNARIIHARRDLRDVAFSCFSRPFTGGHEFTYDLAELGRYCRAYALLMQHWRTVLPEDAILEVQYEELVADLEHHARRLVTHCGLEWDDACLTFYETERTVRTASAMQVRQPIYQSSIGQWRPHAARLQPLLKELEACLPSSHA